MKNLNNLKWLEKKGVNMPIVVSKTEPSGQFGKEIGLWFKPLTLPLAIDSEHPVYGIYVYTGGNSLFPILEGTHIPTTSSLFLLYLIGTNIGEAEKAEVFKELGQSTKYSFIGIFDPKNILRTNLTQNKMNE